MLLLSDRERLQTKFSNTLYGGNLQHKHHELRLMFELLTARTQIRLSLYFSEFHALAHASPSFKRWSSHACFRGNHT